MNIEKTGRGFSLANFADRNGESCSLQKSSIATEDCIWLGINDAKPQVFIPHGDPAWRPMELPKLPPGGDILFTTRMHLNREQVAELIPVLQHFADTGELP
jgi:hypothetical protein